MTATAAHLVSSAMVVSFEPFHLFHQTECQPGARHMLTWRLTVSAATAGPARPPRLLLLLLLLERQQLFNLILLI
jgi:hypothetical protein